MAAEARSGFRFESRAHPGARFRVVGFEGEERLGRCYRFRVELASEGQDPDVEALVGSQACFTILRQPGGGPRDLPFHGIILEFCQRHRAGPLAFYEAVLVPRLHLLSLTRHDQVFLDQTLPEFIAACLEDGGLAAGAFRFALARDPDAWEKRDYLCQYGESHLAFVQRWLEREGLYYFFEQREGEEQVVITDSRIVHGARAGEPEVRYHPASGLGGRHREEVITQFGCCRDLVPLKVALADTGDLVFPGGVRGEARVGDHGHGVVSSFGEHLRTPGEAGRLAGFRAEAVKCRETLYEGRGCVPFLQPGYRFRLRGHFRPDWEGEYLTVEIRHRGSQAGLMPAGPGRNLAPAESEPRYENQFTALPAAVQFRLPCATPSPRVLGVLPATVDAAGDTVHLDEWSRYKLILPFDQSGRGGGKASAWVRMLGPYAGAGYGWNSPLHKGTEVLLGFIDGDPDRPVIAGAVPNPRTPSPVNADNASQVVLRTAGGNRLAFEDQPGRESIHLECPGQGASFHMGALGSSGPGSASLSAANGWEVTAASKTEAVVGNSSSFIGGVATAVHLGATTFAHEGGYLHVVLGAGAVYEGPDRFNYSPSHAKMHELQGKVALESTEYSRLVKQAGDLEKELGALQTSIGKHKEKIIEIKESFGKQKTAFGQLTENYADYKVVRGQLLTLLAQELTSMGAKKTEMIEKIIAKFGKFTLFANTMRSNINSVVIKYNTQTSTADQVTRVTDGQTLEAGGS